MAKIDEVFESDWINHASLQGRKVNLTIRKVTVEKAFDKNSFVLYFDETEKKLRLNKTNAKMLEMLTDSDDSDGWVGVRVTLKPDITSFQGEPKKTVSIESELPEQRSARPIPPQGQKPADPDDIPF